MASYTDYSSIEKNVRAALSTFSFRELDTGALALRPAAVGIVVVADPAPAVLLTLRSRSLRHHSGQFALPGGRVDAGESVHDAAVREVREELGLLLGPEAHLGRLDDYATRSGYCISTLVFGCREPAILRPNADEVAEVYSVPFAELESDAIPLFEPGADPERPVLYSHFPSVGTQMYAPTAALLYQFREVVLAGRATRIDQYDQPRFAWR